MGPPLAQLQNMMNITPARRTITPGEPAAGHDLGFVNPLIYSLGGSDAFRDIVDPSSTVAVARTNWANGVNQWNRRTFSLRTMNQTGTLHTVPGYDDVTGMGTPNGWAFLNALAGK